MSEDKKYVAMEQIGICNVCGKEEDLRFGACYHCSDLVSGEQVSDKTHRLWETLKDARCREKVCWKLGISTEICFDSVTGNLKGVRCSYFKNKESTDMKSSISEAQIAAITAIRDAQE